MEPQKKQNPKIKGIRLEQGAPIMLAGLTRQSVSVDDNQLTRTGHDISMEFHGAGVLLTQKLATDTRCMIIPYAKIIQIDLFPDDTK